MKNIEELDRQISLLETECHNMEPENREVPMEGVKVSGEEEQLKPLANGPSHSAKIHTSQKMVTMPKISSVSSAPFEKFSKKAQEKSMLKYSKKNNTDEISKGVEDQEPRKASLSVCEKEERDDKMIRLKSERVVCAKSESSMSVCSESSEENDPLYTTHCSSQRRAFLKRNYKEQTWSEKLRRHYSPDGRKSRRKKKEDLERRKKCEREHPEVKSSANEPIYGDKQNTALREKREGGANEKSCCDGEAPLHACDPIPTKKGRPRSVRTKKKREMEVPVAATKTLHEKEIQCILWNEEREKEEFLGNLNGSIKTLHLLISELKKKPSQDKRDGVLDDMQNTLMKISGIKSMNELNNSLSYVNVIQKRRTKFFEGGNSDILDLKNSLVGVKQFCEQVSNEKLSLSDEILAKNRMIASLKKKEKEYLSVISNLKFNLEKIKKEAEEGTRAQRELLVLKRNLQDDAKVIEALKRSHMNMQNTVERYALENNKLMTRARLAQMETKKYSVLVMVKEMEIKKYKQEMELFQKHISEQLNLYRSKASEKEIEKAMKAIAKQTEILTQTDAESTFSDNSKAKHTLYFDTTSMESCIEVNSIRGEDEKTGIKKELTCETVREIECKKREESESDHQKRRPEVDENGDDFKSGESDDYERDAFGRNLKWVLANSKKFRSDIDNIVQDMSNWDQASTQVWAPQSVCDLSGSNSIGNLAERISKF